MAALDRVVIVKRDDKEIARYTIGYSWGDTAAPDYFNIASRKAVKEGLVTREDVPKLKFEFAK